MKPKKKPCKGITSEKNEVWMDVLGYEGMYKVSSFGRVKSLGRIVKNRFSYKYCNGRLLKQTTTGLGYKRVSLSVNQKQKTFLVHRIVANSFIPNPKKFRIINHKDENPSNNNVGNLEWCTYKYNSNYGDTQNRRSLKIKNGPCSKKVFQYDLNGHLIKEWPSSSECGRNGFSQACVSRCARLERYTYKGFIWRYEKM